MWFAVTAAINSGLVMWSAGHGGVGGRAVDWSLAAFCIAVASRSPVQFECLWIGRCHRAATGTDLVDRVLAGGSVTLIDTSRGRPDVGACVADVAHQFDAVFVVSNDVVRDAVARACESLGVPWYGPTFDS